MQKDGLGDWAWRIGFLHGYGEAVWQQRATTVRRITKMAVSPQGQLVMMKALPCVVGQNSDPMFEAQPLVIDSIPLREDLCEDATRAWEGSTIVQARANGNPRIQMP